MTMESTISLMQNSAIVQAFFITKVDKRQIASDASDTAVSGLIRGRLAVRHARSDQG